MKVQLDEKEMGKVISEWAGAKFQLPVVSVGFTVNVKADGKHTMSASVEFDQQEKK